MKNKKIFHFANNDYDGAGFHVLNNHNLLIKKKIDSKLFLINKTKFNKNSKKIPLSFEFRFKFFFINLLKRFKFLKTLSRFKNPLSISFHKIKYNKKFINNFIFNKGDIFIFYGFNTVIDTNFLKHISTSDIYFFPMDLEILTGGCHFDLNCMHSIDNLSNLSLKKKNLLKKKIISNYQMKRSIFYEIKPKFLASNKGVLKIIQKSNFDFKDIYLCYLIVKNNRKKYYEKDTCRKIFSVDLNKYVILNISINPEDSRKNIKQYLKIAEYFDNHIYYSNKFVFVYLGSKNPDKKNLKNFKYLRSNFDDNYINKLYRTSDLYLDLSLSDNGPMSVFEAYMNNLSIIISKNSFFSYDLKNLSNVKSINPNNFQLLVEEIKKNYETRKMKLDNDFDIEYTNLLKVIS